MKRPLIALAIVASSLPAITDDDEHVALQHMRFIERDDDDLHVTTKLTNLFDEKAYGALNSGFESTIVISTAVYPKDDRDPIWVQAVVRTVVYDLWDEEYVIKFDEANGPKVPIKVKYQSEALKLLTEIEDLPVVPLVELPYDDVFYLKITVQLNPVSKETLAEVRRWLSQGTGGGLDRGGVFFGSFVSVFVNPKIAEADRVLRIRSQPFFRPKP